MEASMGTKRLARTNMNSLCKLHKIEVGETRIPTSVMMSLILVQNLHLKWPYSAHSQLHILILGLL